MARVREIFRKTEFGKPGHANHFIPYKFTILPNIKFLGSKYSG